MFLSNVLQKRLIFFGPNKIHSSIYNLKKYIKKTISVKIYVTSSIVPFAFEKHFQCYRNVITVSKSFSFYLLSYLKVFRG